MTSPTHAHHHDTTPPQDATAFWEQFYEEREQIWSGRPNAGLAARVQGLPPGRALDLGCGEGGDAIWLAEHGWQVTAVDISQRALDRSRARARADGVESQIEFQQHDLGHSFPTGEYDLVSLQFLQSPVDLPAEVILRQAAAAVAEGGLLLVIYHGAMPPGSRHEPPEGGFPTPEETWRATGVEADGWTVEELGLADRDATLPDGSSAVLTDAIVAARRRAPAPR